MEEGDVGWREHIHHPQGAAKILAGKESSDVLLADSVADLSLLITESFYRFIFQEKTSCVLTGFSRPWWSLSLLWWHFGKTNYGVTLCQSLFFFPPSFSHMWTEASPFTYFEDKELFKPHLDLLFSLEVREPFKNSYCEEKHSLSALKCEMEDFFFFSQLIYFTSSLCLCHIWLCACIFFFFSLANNFLKFIVLLPVYLGKGEWVSNWIQSTLPWTFIFIRMLPDS